MSLISTASQTRNKRAYFLVETSLSVVPTASLPPIDFIVRGQLTSLTCPQLYAELPIALSLDSNPKITQPKFSMSVIAQFMYKDCGGCELPIVNFVLLESDEQLLAENGDNIVLEN